MKKIALLSTAFLGLYAQSLFCSEGETGLRRRPEATTAQQGQAVMSREAAPVMTRAEFERLQERVRLLDLDRVRRNRRSWVDCVDRQCDTCGAMFLAISGASLCVATIDWVSGLLHQRNAQ